MNTTVGGSTHTANACTPSTYLRHTSQGGAVRPGDVVHGQDRVKRRRRCGDGVDPTRDRGEGVPNGLVRHRAADDGLLVGLPSGAQRGAGDSGRYRNGLSADAGTVKGQQVHVGVTTSHAGYYFAPSSPTGSRGVHQ